MRDENSILVTHSLNINISLALDSTSNTQLSAISAIFSAIAWIFSMYHNYAHCNIFTSISFVCVCRI